MKVKHTPIASAVALVLRGAGYPALAQQTDTKPAEEKKAEEKKAEEKKKAGEQEAQTVVVTGIRGSLQQSLARKRNADSHVEVITAEDIGKMPDKNVADSLQRVPGVTISSAGATEGGFDENDRVSMRGTGPSLTQTLINGHNVSDGAHLVQHEPAPGGNVVAVDQLLPEAGTRAAHADTVVLVETAFGSPRGADSDARYAFQRVGDVLVRHLADVFGGDDFHDRIRGALLLE